MSDCLLAASLDVDDDAVIDAAQMVSILTSATVPRFPLFSLHHPLMNLSHFLKFVHLGASLDWY